MKTYIIQSRDEIESIKHAWLSLQNHPNIDYDQYMLNLDNSPNIIRPFIIVVEDEETIISLIIGRVERYKLPIRIGYQNFLGFCFKAIVICYAGFLGDQSPKVLDCVILALEKALKDKSAEMIFINNLPLSSEFYRRIEMKRQSLMIIRFGKQSHWRIALPNTFEEFFNRLDKKTRNNLRWIKNKLSKNEIGEVKIKIYDDCKNLEEFFTLAEIIACKTYQRGLGVGFKDTPDVRKLIFAYAQNNKFRGYIMFIGQRPVAFKMGLIYGEIFHLIHIAYDPIMRNYNPGTGLLFYVLEDLLNRRISRSFDFGIGDAEYKRRYADISWEEESFYIFSKCLKNTAVFLILKGIFSFERTLAKLFEDLKIKSKIKSFWRESIRKKSKKKQHKNPLF